MSLSERVLKLLADRRTRVFRNLGRGSIGVGILSAFVAIPGGVALLVRDYFETESPMLNDEVWIIAAWILLGLSVVLNRWAKREMAEHNLRLKREIRGIKIQDILECVVDQKTSRMLSELIPHIESDAYRARIAYIALMNWQDESRSVYYALMTVKSEIDILFPIRSREEQGLPPVVVAISFAPITTAFTLGLVMMMNDRLMLDRGLGRLLAGLGLVGIVLPQVLPLFFLSKGSNARSESGNIARLTNQVVAWLGVYWGDYCAQVLYQRAKNGDSSAQSFLKVMNKRRTH